MIRAPGAGGPRATRVWLAVAAGVAASASSIALLATSAWLISRASQHPPVLELTVPASTNGWSG